MRHRRGRKSRCRKVRSERICDPTDIVFEILNRRFAFKGRPMQRSFGLEFDIGVDGEFAIVTMKSHCQFVKSFRFERHTIANHESIQNGTIRFDIVIDQPCQKPRQKFTLRKT